MALTPDEQKLLDELTAKMNAADADDFEVEIFSGDKGARIPMSQAKDWLLETFGIGKPPAAAAPPAPAGKQQAGAQLRGLFRGGQPAQPPAGQQQGQQGA